MYKPILQMLQTELLAGSSNIPLLVPIPLDYSVDCCEKDVAPEVKFATVVQKRIFEVFLDDHGALVLAARSHQCFYLRQRRKDADAVASVGVLPWLANPNIVTALLPLTRKRLEVLHKFEELWIFEAGGDVECER